MYVNEPSPVLPVKLGEPVKVFGEVSIQRLDRIRGFQHMRLRTLNLYFALFSPDFRQVAWAAQTAVQLMNADDGTLGPLLNHEDHVTAAAWSPDGQRLATAAPATVEGSLTPAVLVWDTQSGNRLATWPQAAPVKSLAFSPDGRQVAVLDSSGNLQLWDLEP